MGQKWLRTTWFSLARRCSGATKRCMQWVFLKNSETFL